MAREMLIHFYACYDSPNGQSRRTHDYATALANLGNRVVFFTSTYNHLDGRVGKSQLSSEQQPKFAYKVKWCHGVRYRGNGVGRFLHMLWHTLQLLVIGMLAQRPHVIIGTSVPQSVGIAAYLVSKFKRIPFVYEVRDVWPDELIALGAIKPNTLVSKAMTVLQNFLYKKSNLVITALPGVVQQAKQICTDQRVVWVPNGIDCSAHPNELDQVNETVVPTRPTITQVNVNEVKIMYAGSFSFAQDIASLVLACKNLEVAHKKYRCEIVGDGPQYDKVLKYASQLGVEKVKFLGRLSKVELKQALQTADILVSCHRNNDLFKYGVNSNKLYDYLWSGKPVVFAANTTQDPVSLSGAGFKVDAEDSVALYDSLTQLIEMPAFDRQKLGRRGRLYVKENFDLMVLTERYRLALEDVIVKR